MKRYDVMKQWSDGFTAAIGNLGGNDDSKSEHWHAGYLAGYKMKSERNRLLDEYLFSTGREPQAVITIATPPLGERELVELRRDAARYRWLVSSATTHWWTTIGVNAHFTGVLNESIDTARERTGGGE